MPSRIVNAVSRHIAAIMAVSGALTCTMAVAVLFPEAALQSTFGEALDGPLADVLVRNWAALVALVGILLLNGARDPSIRKTALVVAGTSKLVFVTLVLAHGWRFLAHGAGPAIAIDAVMVLLFAFHLAGDRRSVSV